MHDRSRSDSTDLNFLRHRVRSFGLFAGALALSFWLFRLLVNDFEGNGIEATESWTHLLAAVALLAVWAVLGVGKPGRLVVRGVESIGILSSCALLVAMGATLDRGLARPEMTMALALTFVTCSRAVYVPSSGWRTGLINVGVGIVLLVGVYLMYLGTPMDRYLEFEPALAGMTSKKMAEALTLMTAAWWALSSALAVATSRVIYGLRAEANEMRRLGQYQLERKLGAGGMGIVYQAHHAMLRRPTAVKLLPPDKAGEAAVARFEREVKLTARLRHPNTVTIYDYGRTPDGIFYYAMELLEGANLEQVVAESGALPVERVAHVLLHAAGALHEAHELGLIHRDIKPANIMLCNQGGQVDVVKVLDFGLVKDVSPAESERLTAVTQTGVITGTPQYLPPEALTDPENVDARSDLYALAAVGYYLLTGEHVFSGKTAIEVCSRHLHEAPVPPSERLGKHVPPVLEALLLRCLAKSPEERPESASAFIAELEACELAAWEAAAARAWWRSHEAAIRRVAAGESVASSQTMMMDLGRR